MAKKSHLAISSIRIDGDTQPRELIDQAVVAEYAEAMKAGAEFPPVVVFADGANNWLADGFHRYHAARHCGLDSLAAEIRPGTQRDAVLYSVGANASHGLRRTNADKRRAVMKLLQDDEWGKWTDNEIARRCGIAHTSVQRYRLSLAQCASDDSAQPPRTYTTKHGTVTTMNTAKIGRKPRPAGAIAKDAYRPTVIPIPSSTKINLGLPTIPATAARLIIDTYGASYALELAQEIAKAATESE